jgi:hypothetical protein
MKKKKDAKKVKTSRKPVSKTKSKNTPKKVRKAKVVKRTKSNAGKKSSAIISNKSNTIEKFGYPVIDEGKTVYVQYPVLKKNSKWVGADVLKDGGYISVEDNPLKTEFNTFEECQKACNVHNTYHGWTKEEVTAIISESMDADGTRRTKQALEYVETGRKDRKFYNSSKKEWNDFTGSVEIYEQKKAEGKINTDKDLAVLCLDEAELWFEGFGDDSEQNRKDFTASLYRHIVSIKEKNAVYQEQN